ncbi:MAG: hypothetical protein CK425_01530 [Parachlamydia sp.]|nr:MAG: hypothetical protein CK425_01530 [Parachlamydia sp.]
MKRIIILARLSLIMAMNSTICAESAQSATKSQLEMRVYEVERIHSFEDPDEGAFFKLSDGSCWLRTWWEGPVYDLQEGQKVAIIPMTDEEAVSHQKSAFPQAQPFWIIPNPKEDISLVGIAFKLTTQFF